MIPLVFRSPYAIAVQYPANLSMGVITALVEVLVLVCGYVWLYKHRPEVTHGLRRLLPLLCESLPSIFGAFDAITAITAEASYETGMLTVRRMVAGSLTGRVFYPSTNVRGVQIGFDRGCKYLYANLANGSDPKLFPCSPRTGYSQVASVLNSFLGNLRGAFSIKQMTLRIKGDKHGCI